MNARATPFYTRKYEVFTCAAYTKIERCHIQAHEVCRIHACTILHTYCTHTAYIISATLLHILGMYTAYILHMCTPAHVTHVCCTRAAHTIHPYCMHARTQKLVQHHSHAIQAYEEMYAVCVQLFTCSMYAVHKQLHVCCT